MTLCGKDLSGAALYAFPERSQPRQQRVLLPLQKAAHGWPQRQFRLLRARRMRCLAPDKASAAGMKRCSGSSAACSTDPSGRLMYCYVTDRGTKEGKAAVSTTIYPAYREMPPASVPATPVPTAPSPAGASFPRSWTFSGRSLAPNRPASPSRLVFCNGRFTNLMTDTINCGSAGTGAPRLTQSVAGAPALISGMRITAGGAGRSARNRRHAVGEPARLI